MTKLAWLWLGVSLGCSRSPGCPAQPSKGAAVAASAASTARAPVTPAAGAAEPDPELRLDTIRLPPGFFVSAYATHVAGARSLALSPAGTLFVGTRGSGKVYAIPAGSDGAVGQRVLVLARNLDTPNGVAWHGGALYVAETTRVLRFDDIEQHLEAPPAPVVVSERFPEQSQHEWKFIAIGPDDRLYVPVGAPCNVCEVSSPFATITRMRLDGSGFEIVARGVRNSVGFDWQPRTGKLWFTDNGRDRLGDDIPPDELNRVDQPGENFGFPECHGMSIVDPQHGHVGACDDTQAPELELGAHVAALGMRFYTGGAFPARYRGQIFIAEHGSWNRSKKVGYRIALVRVQGEKAVGVEAFATGWLQGQKAWGRPVDLVVARDGALLVSDDAAGCIYRIAHQSR